MVGVKIPRRRTQHSLDIIVYLQTVYFEVRSSSFPVCARKMRVGRICEWIEACGKQRVLKLCTCVDCVKQTHATEKFYGCLVQWCFRSDQPSCQAPDNMVFRYILTSPLKGWVKWVCELQECNTAQVHFILGLVFYAYVAYPLLIFIAVFRYLSPHVVYVSVVWAGHVWNRRTGFAFQVCASSFSFTGRSEFLARPLKRIDKFT